MMAAPRIALRISAVDRTAGRRTISRNTPLPTIAIASTVQILSRRGRVIATCVNGSTSAPRDWSRSLACAAGPRTRSLRLARGHPAGDPLDGEPAYHRALPDGIARRQRLREN